jgi:hypothetical protein
VLVFDDLGTKTANSFSVSEMGQKYERYGTKNTLALEGTSGHFCQRVLKTFLAQLYAVRSTGKP